MREYCGKFISLTVFIVFFLFHLHMAALSGNPCLAAASGVSAVPISKEAVSSPGDSGVDPQYNAGPSDKFNRGNPRTMLEGFLYLASKGNFTDAANYLDTRYLPAKLKDVPADELARKLKIVLDRALWLDMGSISNNPVGNLNDGLPAYRELIGQVKIPEGVIDILLQRVPRGDGVKIWKFSNRTVARIPLLYKYYGYRLFEEKLSSFFPDMQFMGWQLWQWSTWLLLVIAAYVLVWAPTWIAALVIRRKQGSMALMLSRFIAGPVRILLWLGMGRMAAFFLMPSAELKELLNAGTIFILALCWASLSVLDMIFVAWKLRLKGDGKEGTIVLLKPLSTVIRVSLVIIALLLWLDNIGFKVSTLLAGLGVGGLAVALAAQNILRNLLGTIMILMDSPYNVGERIVVNGYDGEVEEIGLRSTRLRLLTGHQTSIPNDKIERAAIENIGRRPSIRRRQDIRLALDTPPARVERAVRIIREILDNHQGMEEDYPPRVYFDRFKKDALNIVMFYWYHPPEYWEFLEFNQKINSAILNAFEKEGIKLALPASASFVAGIDDALPLKIEASGSDGL